MSAAAQTRTPTTPTRPRWPRAPSSNAIMKAVLKKEPEDFRVFEELPLEFSGEGEHLYLHVEKRGFDTVQVAELLASHFGVPAASVGYAGRKDRWAVTRQWFSVPTPVSGAGVTLPDVDVLASERHARKLRRGDHAGNRFEIRLRDVSADSLVVNPVAPNYFGEQRFGSANLERARDWLARRRERRISKAERGWHLSVLRSFLFNEVLAARIGAGNWQARIAGDVLVADQPTGPLWGRGRSPARDAAAAVERRALEPHAELCEGLEFAGVDQGRRPFTAIARDLTVVAEGTDTVVGFFLPAGAYATSFLAASVELVDGRHL